MGAFDNASFEEITAILGQGDPNAVSEGAWQWTTMQRSLQELATVLASHRVSLLRDSGWSGPSAEQFDSYMTAMTQQINAMADSAGTISTQLYNAQEALSTARAYLPDGPPPGFNINDPTLRTWPLYVTSYGDPSSGPVNSDGTTPNLPSQTARQYYDNITQIARDQANSVATAYDAAATSLTRSQATAPVSSNFTTPADSPQPGQQYGGSASSPGSRAQGVVRGGLTADGSGNPTLASRSGGSVASTAPGRPPTDPILQPTGGAAPGGRTDPSNPYGPGLAASNAALGSTGGPGDGGDYGRGDWLPGGVPEGSSPGGTIGRGGTGPGRGAGSNPGSGSADGANFGDGSDGIWGGTRVSPSVTGRSGVPKIGRPLGEVEPGIFGGEPGGGGRVVGGRGPSAIAGDGVSGGRLEASPAEEQVPGRWPRSGGGMEGEPRAGAFPGGMPTGAAGAGRENERGKRPKYLKQDPEYWQSKQDVVPPVIE